MTSITLQNLKEELIEQIKKEESFDLLQRIRQLIHKEKEKLPCQFTKEELKQQIDKSIEDFNNGRFYTMEEVRKMFSA